MTPNSATALLRHRPHALALSPASDPHPPALDPRFSSLPQLMACQDSE